MSDRVLTAIPVYNEAPNVARVLAEVVRHASDILVVDDGSSDGTPQALAAFPGVRVERHSKNLGYGAALRTAFEIAIRDRYDVVVTLDCDGQHEPQRIRRFVKAAQQADIISGSRYLRRYPQDSRPPEDRRRINQLITEEVNRRLGLALTDAFCGFKAYRVSAVKHLNVTENGYAMPLEFWVQAVHAGLTIRELPVPLIYLDEKRSFGGSLDNPWTRYRHYLEVFNRAMSQYFPFDVAKEARLRGCGEVAG